MRINLFFSALFFACPLILIVLFGICLYQCISAKKQNNMAPGTISDAEIKKHKTKLIVLSIVTAVLGAIIIGLIVLVSMEIAHM